MKAEYYTTKSVYANFFSLRLMDTVASPARCNINDIARAFHSDAVVSEVIVHYMHFAGEAQAKVYLKPIQL